ncbi:hypothetical protein Bca4012_058388 [Brassica carinata]|uniref:Uncharacterized protein n=1 Tax=Brassica carinata TaxID=52824 RepID=A0A8X7W3C4_BRACI|nr:hypothetical protein Bca52824_016124 [Brassica carinata]
MLEKRGLPVPSELKDLLIANEEKFRKEAEEVVVEVITERDLALLPSRSTSEVARRSLLLSSMASTITQTSLARPMATVVPGNWASASDRPFGTVSGPFGTVPGRPSRDDSTEEQEARVSDWEESGTAGIEDASSSDPSSEA